MRSETGQCYVAETWHDHPPSAALGDEVTGIPKKVVFWPAEKHIAIFLLFFMGWKGDLPPWRLCEKVICRVELTFVTLARASANRRSCRGAQKILPLFGMRHFPIGIYSIASIISYYSLIELVWSYSTKLFPLPYSVLSSSI